MCGMMKLICPGGIRIVKLFLRHVTCRHRKPIDNPYIINTQKIQRFFYLQIKSGHFQCVGIKSVKFFFNFEKVTRLE